MTVTGALASVGIVMGPVAVWIIVALDLAVLSAFVALVKGEYRFNGAVL